MNWFKKIVQMILVGAGLFSTLVDAHAKDAQFDDLVSELQSSLKKDAPPENNSEDPFSSVKLVFGAALAGSMLSVDSSSAMAKGFDLHFGIELLTPHWLAEGSYRSFGSEKLKDAHSVSLREFDFKIVNKSSIQNTIWLRAGAGISARYLKHMRSQVGYSETVDKTPTFVALLGVEKNLSPKVSFGPDITYRSPLVGETSEKASVDGSLRLNLYF